MNKELTELVFILDRSGSMNGLEDDTIGGFNSFIEKQKNVDGKCLVTTILFNQYSKVVHDRVDLNEIKKMSREDYFASGSTALMDAMGDAIVHIEKIHKYIREEDVPAQTIFVIITDGLENASTHYSSSEVKEMVSKRKNEGWEFLFLAANIDAVETAKKYGISEDRSVEFTNDDKGIEKNFVALSKVVRAKRMEGSIDANWADEIVEYHKKKKTKK